MRREISNNQVKESRKFGKDITNQVNIGEKYLSRINNQILIKESEHDRKENNNSRHVIKVVRAKTQSMDENLLKTLNPLEKEKIQSCKGVNLKEFKNHCKPSNVTNRENFTKFQNLNNLNNFKNANNRQEYDDIYMKTVSAEKKDSLLKIVTIQENKFVNEQSKDKSYFNEFSYPHELYLDEIYINMQQEEFLFFSPLNFQQKEINERMRTILVNWIFEVIIKFKLRQATFFLTIQILDQYLSLKQVSKVFLQLVGVSSLLIACKYEEIYYPEIRDLVYITDHTYTQKQIISMEYEILVAINFFVLPVYPVRFFEILSNKFSLTDLEINFCSLILTICCYNYKINEFPPSIVACSCVQILWKIRNTFSEERKKQISFFLNKNMDREFIEREMTNCCKVIFSILESINLPIFSLVREKYDLRQFFKLKLI